MASKPQLKLAIQVMLTVDGSVIKKAKQWNDENKYTYWRDWVNRRDYDELCNMVVEYLLLGSGPNVETSATIVTREPHETEPDWFESLDRAVL